MGQSPRVSFRAEPLAESTAAADVPAPAQAASTEAWATADACRPPPSASSPLATAPRKPAAQLAAAYGDDDLQAVPVGQHLLIEAAARHDLAVALQRNALAGQLHILDKGGDADGLLEFARRAVY